MTELDARVSELESRLAFMDDSIQLLNDVIVKQQQCIDLLERKVAALINVQQEIRAQLVDVAENEAPPPHY